jgi:hypothetical protein
MIEHAVVIAGGGPTGMMLAGELALAGVDAAIVERRASPDLPGSRAGGLHSRTIEVLDQRGIADRFLAEGQTAQVNGFASVRLDISDFPTRHPYGLGLWHSRMATAIVEGAIFIAGVWVYTSTTRARDNAGRWIFGSFIAFLILMYLINIQGNPPTGVPVLEWSALIGMLILLLWAWWVDRHRVCQRRHCHGQHKTLRDGRQRERGLLGFPAPCTRQEGRRDGNAAVQRGPEQGTVRQILIRQAAARFHCQRLGRRSDARRHALPENLSIR